MELTLRINGRDRSVRSEEDTPLLYVLRDELKLKGAKFGCGLEQCGACAVLADGEATFTCVSPAAAFAGSEIVTPEGLAETECGARVQAAFAEASAAQCGYCTPGLAIAATALLMRNPSPSREEAKAEMQMHLCRCGSHPRVLRAVELAASRNRK
ncbi:MAG: (2Fe-2S)-binding protein [Albidovulum sp.]|nr:(2Fe-2S)-binding protein [Albidovulum sp.]